LGTEHYFGGGGQTDLHPAALIILIAACILISVLPRRYAYVPVLLAALLVPVQEGVILGGLHFTLSRILLFFGWLRLLAVRVREGSSGMRWTSVDKIFIAYCLANAVMFFLLWGEMDALVNRFGFLLNALGMYFFMRNFVRSETDLDRVAKTLAWFMVMLAVFMVNEQITGRNVCSVLGGVPEITSVRDGKIRSQGPFAHALTAGTVGAVLSPLFFGLWWQRRRSKAVAWAGAAASGAVAACSMSSTPVLVLVAGWFALAMWPLRRHLRWFRWGTVVLLVGLHLVMKAPVWALIGRIDLTGSSSSYHRFALVDQFIRRFGEWWLVGTRYTYNWGWDMWDNINTYVAQGTDGGLLTFVLFIALIAVAFHRLGVARKAKASHPEHARRLWVLGSMLFAHTVAFWGIGYFDQSSVVWYVGLAMIATAVSLKPVGRQRAKVVIGSWEAPNVPQVQPAHSMILARTTACPE